MGPTSQPGGQPKSAIHFSRHIAWSVVVAVTLAMMAFVVATHAGEKTTREGVRQDANAPRQHFRLKNPAQISDDDAEAIYAALQVKMAKAYATSGIAAAREYQNWQRYNSAPFQSAAHGRRLVNHYANQIASAYGAFEKAGILPVGSVIAKDNITVIGKNKIHPGALLLMEKMPTGFNYVSGDWRYTMIMPDGSLFGTTNGAGSKKVKFCIACHLAAEKHDHLHFPPKMFRQP